MNQTSVQTTHLPHLFPSDCSLKTNTQFDLLSPTSLDETAFDSALDFQFAEANKESGASIFDFDSVPQLSTHRHTVSLDGGLVKANMLDNAPRNFPATPDSDAHNNDSLSPLSNQVHDDSTSEVSVRRQSKQNLKQTDAPTKQNAASIGAGAELAHKHKKQRKTSNGREGVEAERAAGKETQKERSRAKNKVAAAKCRLKKRENMDNIESDHRTLSAENVLLKREEQQLRASVAQLRTLALDHQSCNCGVHQYNMFEAKKLAQGLGHMQSSGVHAAPCRFDYRAMSMSMVPTTSSADFHPRPRSQSLVGHPHLEEAHDEEMFSMEEPVFEENNIYDFGPGVLTEA